MELVPRFQKLGMPILRRTTKLLLEWIVLATW
jgi:hypothetical protein